MPIAGALELRRVCARLKSPEFFIQDDYKVRSNFTLNLGVRYQIQHGGMKSMAMRPSSIPPLRIPPAARKVPSGTAAPHANGRTSLQANVWDTVLPRVGFSWLPYPTMTIRGGFGMYAYNWSLDTYGAGMARQLAQREARAIKPTVSIQRPFWMAPAPTSSPVRRSPTFPSPPIPPHITTRASVTTSTHTPMPEIYQWNLSVQNQLGTNMVFELAYVASHAKNLNFNVDINHVPVNKPKHQTTSKISRIRSIRELLAAPITPSPTTIPCRLP